MTVALQEAANLHCDRMMNHSEKRQHCRILSWHTWSK